MNLLKFQQYAKVCECENITQASKELFITQSALSQAISAVENYFGCPLFERKHQKIYMNREGKLAYQYINEILEKLDDLQDALRGTSDSILKINSADSTLYTLLAAHYLIEYPNIHIENSYSDTKKNADPLRLLKNGHAHLTIQDTPVDSREVLNMELLTEDSYVIVPEDSPFFGKNEACLREFEGCSFYRNKDLLKASSGYTIGERSKEYIEKNNYALNIEYIDFSAMRLMWKRSRRYFFTCTLSLLSNPDFQYMDPRRFVRLTDRQLTHTFWISCLKRETPAVTRFLDWLCSPANSLLNRPEIPAHIQEIPKETREMTL